MVHEPAPTTLLGFRLAVLLRFVCGSHTLLGFRFGLRLSGLREDAADAAIASGDSSPCFKTPAGLHFLADRLLTSRRSSAW